MRTEMARAQKQPQPASAKHHPVLPSEDELEKARAIRAKVIEKASRLEPRVGVLQLAIDRTEHGGLLRHVDRIQYEEAYPDLGKEELVQVIRDLQFFAAIANCSARQQLQDGFPKFASLEDRLAEMKHYAPGFPEETYQLAARATDREGAPMMFWI